MTWLRKRPVAIGISTAIVIISFIIMIVRDEEINNNNTQVHDGFTVTVTQQEDYVTYTITITDEDSPYLPLTRPPVDPLPRPEGYLPLGSTFDFDNLRITLGDMIGWTYVDTYWSSLHRQPVFYIPISITNNHTSSHRLDGWRVIMFGPDGLRLDEVDFYFDNNAVGGRNDMRPGATFHSYLHILYDGDGEYVIEFSDWNDTIEVIFQVQR